MVLHFSEVGACGFEKWKVDNELVKPFMWCKN